MMTRRHALKLGATAALGTCFSSACAAPGAGKPGLKLGVASYSLAKLSPDEVIHVLHDLDIQYVSLYRTHCPWNGTADECRAAAKKFTDAGLTVTGSGVPSGLTSLFNS